jgi:hypothetical protein
MRERPILFSAPMVRALLAGTKTQTRRVVKPQPWASCVIEEGMDGETPFVYSALSGHGPGYDVEETRKPCRCPYGQPGDRLWVRETWRVCGGREYEYQQDRSQVMYRSTHQEDGFPLGWESYVWRPSIFMPRWASRITLEVTGVRVERLQDISEADCAKEGAPFSYSGFAPEDAPDWRGWYRDLWESINGPGSWDANPWVWVVEFKRLEKPL